MKKRRTGQAAFRFGAAGATLSIAIAAGVAIGVTANDVGPFFKQPIDHKTLSTQVYIAVAALTVAVPDGVYASSMLADPLAYPLVLSTIYLGVCLVERSTTGLQLAFALCSALVVLARVQYAVVPVAVLGAELVADRGHVLVSLRREMFWIPMAFESAMESAQSRPSRQTGRITLSFGKTPGTTT